MLDSIIFNQIDPVELLWCGIFIFPTVQTHLLLCKCKRYSCCYFSTFSTLLLALCLLFLFLTVSRSFSFSFSLLHGLPLSPVCTHTLSQVFVSECVGFAGFLKIPYQLYSHHLRYVRGHKDKARNTCLCIEYFNHLGMLVRSEVLCRLSLTKRVQVIEVIYCGRGAIHQSLMRFFLLFFFALRHSQ